MSRAYETLKKSGVTSGPVFEKTGEKIIEMQKVTEEAGVIEFPELAIDTFPEAARECEQLYNNILVLGRGNVRTLMVCGPKAGEGATTMSLNLAAFIAVKKNIPVLLVEANLRTPVFYRCVQGRCLEGFSSFLLNQGRLKNYLMKSTVPNLSAIMAGRVSGEEMDRFSISQLKSVIQECLSGYRFVVFDSMPASDILAAELASCVDGVVMVLKPATPMKMAMAARNSLERSGARILGVVVNQYNR